MTSGTRAAILTTVVTISFASAVVGILQTLPDIEENNEPTPRKLAATFYQNDYSNTLLLTETDQERSDLALALIAAGSPHDYPHWRSIAPESAEWNVRRSAADLFRSSGKCDVHVHFSVYHSVAWTQVMDWVYEVNNAFDGYGLAMCFHRDTRLPDTECGLDQNRVRCSAPDSRYANQLHVVVGETGIANTLNGQVHISLDADADVLIHELGHTLGLADEYPMRYELAMQFCSGQFRFDPLNLKITQSDLINQQQYEDLKARLPWAEYLEQPIATKTELGGNVYWRLGSSDVSKPGLFPAATCDGTPYQAWKPVAERTFMEQHETGSVPELYLKLLQQSLSRQTQRF